jgi:hypothetical protein
VTGVLGHVFQYTGFTSLRVFRLLHSLTVFTSSVLVKSTITGIASSFASLCCIIALVVRLDTHSLAHTHRPAPTHRRALTHRRVGVGRAVLRHSGCLARDREREHATPHHVR